MIRFGPSGNSQSFYDEGYKHSIDAMKWISDKGLNAFEFSFGRGISISDETARKIGEQAQLNGVEISVHAPYYINFANPSDEMAEKSYGYLMRSCEKLQCFGGKRIVFHASTVGKTSRSEAVWLTHKRIEILLDRIHQNNLQSYMFCPETMGKLNQIGDLDEIIAICAMDSCLVPTIDFGHLNARTFGGLKTKDDYLRILDKLVFSLGYEKANKMHIHFSKIEYGASGEIRHLTFDDKVFGPEFYPLAVALRQFNLNPVIICESNGTQAEDAVYMKEIYESLKSE